jgi:hypothetical protein
LDDANLVVEAFDEGKRDLVVWLAVAGDAIPVSVDHVGEPHVALEALPVERYASG